MKRTTLPTEGIPHHDKGTNMRNSVLITCVFLLFGCGVESAGTAATIGKLQAEQAKQAKESMDKLKADLDASLKETEQNRKKAEEAANN